MTVVSLLVVLSLDLGLGLVFVFALALVCLRDTPPTYRPHLPESASAETAVTAGRPESQIHYSYLRFGASL